MNRLGILGGTFNPPHKGHIYIAQQARYAADLDRVLIVPCGNPPHKSVVGNVDAHTRLEMTRLAIENVPWLELCDIEVRSAEKSYTAHTLKLLKELYPDCELCFIVGGDSLRDLEGWYRPEIIFQLAEIVSVSRKEVDCKTICEKAELYRKKYNAKITSVEVEPFEASSSEIRRRLMQGEDLSALVDKKVLKYIEKNKIYKEA